MQHALLLAVTSIEQSNKLIAAIRAYIAGLAQSLIRR